MIDIHERVSEYRCQAGLGNSQTRHECNRVDEHDGVHSCTCGRLWDDATVGLNDTATTHG